MLDIFNGPCMATLPSIYNNDAAFPHDIFSAMPIFSEMMVDAPHGKRRCYKNYNKTGGNEHTQKHASRARSHKKQHSMNYKIEKLGNGNYELQLSKKIGHNVVAKAINDQVSVLAEKYYVPSYSVVRDIFGRQYYVEEETDEEELRQKVMSQIDIGDIKRKIARQQFNDYEFELNHRGDEVIMFSKSDKIEKEFNFGENLEDIRMKYCTINNKNTEAVLCVELIASEGHNINNSVFAQPVNHANEVFPDPISDLSHQSSEEENEENEAYISTDDELNTNTDGNTSDSSDVVSDAVSDSDSSAYYGESVTKVYSPILENVEDEEIDRYRKSFEHSPSGYAIIEDL